MFNNNWHNKPIGVFALKSEKNIDSIAQSIHNAFSVLYITTIPGTNLLPTNELAHRLTMNNINCLAIQNIELAMTIMKNQVTKDRPGLIFGSHYMAKAVFDYFSFSFDKGII